MSLALKHHVGRQAVHEYTLHAEGMGVFDRDTADDHLRQQPLVATQSASVARSGHGWEE